MSKFDPILSRAIFSDNAIYLAIFIAICCFFLWIYDELKLPDDYSWLPAVHQPGGSRDKHDDWKIWPFSKVPRTWTSYRLKYPPLKLLGNQNLWNNFDVKLNEDVGVIGSIFDRPWPIWGLKPIPPVGAWQLSLNFPIIFGFVIPLPYFAYRSKDLQVYLGCRFSDGPGERYASFPTISVDLNG